jgi:CRISPR-associated endonuclease/helicase Cas3
MPRRGHHVHYAHSTNDESRANWQQLAEHLIDTANLGERFGQRIGLAKAARLAGLLHDVGKYTQEFQARLHGTKGRVDHSTAGAVIVRQLAKAAKPDDRLVAELIAYAIAGHHAGLPDKQGESFSTLSERLKSFSESALDAIWKIEIEPDATDLLPAFNWERKDPGKAAFQLAFLGRMIFSCLVDADFKDTERFYARIERRKIDREWPALQSILPGLIEAFDRHMNEKRNAETAVNRLRAEILDHVRARAAVAPGLFTLTVPTGGGKTLASLGFALDHVRVHGHERIIYAIPFTAIID